MPINKNFISTLSLILVLGTILTSSLPIDDIDCKSLITQIKELYDYLLANGQLRALHELVRKDGRIPSLRLRFGKRSDPNWATTSSVPESNYVD